MRLVKAARTVLVIPLVGLAGAALATPITIEGRYIKAGVSDFGTLGSNGATSPGLIHDPAGTGTFDDNFDYIAPGTPHDGFSLRAAEFSFTQNDNTGIAGFGSSSPFLLTGADALGYTHAVGWTGGNEFLTITNSYFMNNGDERIRVITKVTALKDLSELAFARSVDPDSDSRSHGTSSSDNQRGNSVLGPNDFIGSAGSVSGLTLALINLSGTTYEHGTQISTSCCSNIDPYDVLANPGPLSSVGDHGLNMAWRIGKLTSGNTATIEYAYAVGDNIDVIGEEPDPAPIPEPASWAMMISGFGLVGTMARRSRRAGRAFA